MHVRRLADGAFRDRSGSPGVHDWDSMITDGEDALVGLAAVYSTVSGDDVATVEETERFLEAYCHARGRQFTTAEVGRSWAAGLWTRASDAKYQHTAGGPSPRCRRTRHTSGTRRGL